MYGRWRRGPGWPFTPGNPPPRATRRPGNPRSRDRGEQKGGGRTAPAAPREAPIQPRCIHTDLVWVWASIVSKHLSRPKPDCL